MNKSIFNIFVYNIQRKEYKRKKELWIFGTYFKDEPKKLVVN